MTPPRALTAMRRAAMSPQGGLLAAAAVLAGPTYVSYPGSPWVLSGFHLAFLAMLALAVPRPRTDAYSFLAIFLFLGFWLKFTAHQWIGYGFVEPVGAFAGTAGQWDTALRGSAAAACGVAAWRALQLGWWRRGRPAGPGATLEPMADLAVPSWYAAAPARVWLCLGGLAVLLYAANFRFAFFVTGVDARVVLPLRLGALAAWAVYCGLPMLVMLCADWDYQRRPDRLWPLVAAPSVLGVVMSASMLSRASTIFLYAALGMAGLAHRRFPLRRLWLGRGWLLSAGMALALVASLAVVSVTRLHVYEEPAPRAVAAAAAPRAAGTAPAPATPQPPAATAPSPVPPTTTPPPSHLRMTPGLMLRQVLLLTTDRWVGLEGMLALSASDRPGAALLRAGLLENPRSGVHSIYQTLARSPYRFQPGFTYLTLPGLPVVLGYSGAPLVVGAGMFAACAVICLIGGLARRLTRSTLLSAWLGLLLANAICQMSFPYLTFVFVGLCTVALLALHWLLQRMAGGKRAMARHA